ncbi:thiamine-phosphate kinase [Gleimia sp. 6138-11-ORH1]|uniref:thiamine-phosphate kinase n=1 Tax=Gleimia sp. 6138-11-ORH1 TaxID=2973937 RepID=UPI0021689E1C|nr:thiamine-phosphate kinase [Gleimia sp. 6138-11-ORH1]MCS4484519.1 thiamine-phosphate kinase [Gleimia sp. 6138-11-ORH1]
MGEDQLIARMRELLPVGERTLVWSGDDCAEVASPTGSFLISTDVLVENVHFRLDWSSPFEIGARAAAQNLADIMAQGGRATAVVVSLVIPPHLDPEWLCDLVEGFSSCVKATSAGVVGGDISKGNQLVMSVTVCGEAVTGKLPGSVVRSGAQPGDVIAVAGTLGHSYAGFLLCSAKETASRWERFISIYKVPQPPLELGPLAAGAGANALMDISDGLSTDLRRLAKASQVRLTLSEDALNPFISQLREVAAKVGKPPLELVLTGGEDHALLGCFPKQTELPTGFIPIGTVSADSVGVWLDDKEILPTGWDHLL